MKTKYFKIIVNEYSSINELPDSDVRLIYAAREASKNAYSPYSEFNVGAAILLQNGEIISGSNQENSAYPNGLCAERVSLFYANSKFPDNKVLAIAVSAKNFKGIISEPISPCGSCRQALMETEIRFKQKIRIILDSKKKILVFYGTDNLLPFAFKPDTLG
ncbi:MAG: cytidine deaminase [Bacteroidales bacterium]|jgi:cytidine deaminase|nr:cytidine deaminase [Bacteroidales bacterium]